MLEVTTREHRQDRAAAILGLLKRGLTQFIGIDLLLRPGVLVPFTPFTARLTARPVAWSGSGAIADSDRAHRRF